MHVDVEVEASPELVWGVLTDWGRHGEWVPFTRAEGGSGVGADLEAWTGVGPFGFLDTMKITEWRPPYRLTVRHTGELVKGEGFFDLLGLPGGRCRVRWAELIDVPFGAVGRVGWIGAAPVVKLVMRTALRRLGKVTG